MPPLTIHITARHSGLAVRPVVFAENECTYLVSIRLNDSDTSEQRLSILWDDSTQKLLRDLTVPSSARVHRAGSWLAAHLTECGWEHAAETAREYTARGQTVEVCIESDAPEILSLPWHLLPIGSQRLKHVPGIRLRLTWLRASPRADDPDNLRREGRLGVAWSSAGGHISEAAHLAEVQSACTAAGRPLDVATDVCSDASLEGLDRWLQRSRAHDEPLRALFIICRTTPLPDGRMGVVMNAERGPHKAVVVPPETLADVLHRHADMVRTVNLLTISSDPLAPQSTRTLGPAIALQRSGIASVLASRLPLSRSASVKIASAVTSALMQGSGGPTDALQAAKRALLAPEDARDRNSLVLLSGNDSASQPALLRRPWPGLSPYTELQSRFFFGRDSETDNLVETIETLSAGTSPRVVVVTGGSGTGKSSLLRAGVAPRLETSGEWAVRFLYPAGDIEARLGEVLDPITPTTAKTLIVVDPFEAVLNLPSTASQRLVRTLWRHAAKPSGSVNVLLIIRTEYLGRCGQLVVDEAGTRLESVALVRPHQVLIEPPGPRALQMMLSGPASAAGVTFDPDLAHRIASHLSTMPPQLPALAAALATLWDQREGRNLTQKCWEHLATKQNLLSSYAESVLINLPPGQASLAIPVLRALTEPPSPQQPGRGLWLTRARLRSQLPDAEPAHVDAVTATLVGKGLLRDSAGPEGAGVTLAHDSLANLWPRLAEPTEQPASTLFTSSLAQTHVAEPEAVRPPKRPARRTVPVWPFVLVSVLAIVTTLVVLTYGWNHRESRLAADSALDHVKSKRGDPTLAVVGLRAAAGAADQEAWLYEANLALQETLSHAILRGLDGPVDAVRFSAEADRVLTLSAGIPVVWDVRQDAEPIARPDRLSGGRIIDAAFRPSGASAILVTRTGSLLEWNFESAEPRTLWAPESGIGATAVAISNSGQHILVATEAMWYIVDPSGATIASGELPADEGAQPSAPIAAAIDDDGTRWAVAGRDGRIHLWNSELPDPARIQHPGVDLLEINASGSHLLSLGDGRLRLTDLTRMRGVTRTPSPVQVHAARFSPIGRHILVDYTHRETGEHHARTLSVDLRSEQFETEALRVPATALLVDETRDRLIRGREDGRIEELDRRDGRVLRILRGHQARVTALETSPDGRWLATASADQTVRIWPNRVADSGVVPPLSLATVEADALSLTPDGRGLIANLGEDGWQRQDFSDPQNTPEAVDAPDTGMADINKSARGTRDGRLSIGDEEVKLFELAVKALCVSRDKNHIAAISQIGEVSLWSRKDGVVTPLGSVEPVPRKCRVAADGYAVLTRGRSQVDVWRPDRPGQPVLTTRAAPETDGPTSVFTEDGRQVLTMEETSDVRRWDLDPASLERRLWSRTQTCGGLPTAQDLGTFCACESCYGRTPERCADAGSIAVPTPAYRSPTPICGRD